MFEFIVIGVDVMVCLLVWVVFGGLISSVYIVNVVMVIVESMGMIMVLFNIVVLGVGVKFDGEFRGVVFGG